ncbi:outer membrane protein assembly factor BamB family protein [Halocatena salina]|uniref:PQQ-binding-like beta-propeller repeat protein n=1 Tax=Halocatena salina TaxID=2934340 RepID=A0A8U0A407_9EURY|nr:PQQ-binding-like beta-propeller repeat protein [Halocatena salina]UPM43586.1 PQQ-binding-like beta-propeller repeat protein [Halocatena salina]
MKADNLSRRRVMKSVGTIAGVGVVNSHGENRRTEASERTEQSVISPPEPESQTAWPQVGGDAANTGTRRGARGPKTSITFRWQVEGKSPLSGVVVKDATVYTNDEHRVYALSAADGSTRWSIGTDRSHRVSAPAVGDALVYVGTGSYKSKRERDDPGAYVSHVRAVDRATGEDVWRFEPNRLVDRFHTPTISDGIIYTVGRSVGAGTVGRLYALNGESGELLWTHPTGRSGINGYDAPPVAVTDGTVYLTADKLTAIDGATGGVNWSVDPAGTYKATGINAPAVADGRLYVGRGTETATMFEARSVTDGTLLWEHTVTPPRTARSTRTSRRRKEDGPLPGRWTTPAVSDDSVYVGFNERSPRTNRASVVTALRSDDGTVRWQTSFTDDRHVVYTPATTEKTLYTGGTALALDDGTVRWRLAVPPTRRIDAFAPPAISDDTVYVGGDSLRAITGPL